MAVKESDVKRMTLTQYNNKLKSYDKKILDLQNDKAETVRIFNEMTGKTTAKKKK